MKHESLLLYLQLSATCPFFPTKELLFSHDYHKQEEWNPSVDSAFRVTFDSRRLFR